MRISSHKEIHQQIRVTVAPEAGVIDGQRFVAIYNYDLGSMMELLVPSILSSILSLH